MKNKILCFIISLFYIFSPISVNAYETNADTDTLINGILEYKMKTYDVDSVSSLIDKGLSSDAGISAEWYIFGLSRSGVSYDFSEYEKSLCSYLNENKISSASSRIKYALVLASIGSKNEYISSAMNDSIGKQGIMSYIFGLHMLNNGYESELVKIDEVKNQIISMQLSDGGFAVLGQKSDVDVTAMAIQALCAHYGSDENVTASVDKALEFLSKNQLSDGTFSSYGVSNAESTSQVLTALSGLKIDCMTDTRFIKENNIIEAIKSFMSEDGGFSHTKDSQTSDSATAEVLYSLVAYQRMITEKSPLYIFTEDNIKPARTDIPDTKNTSKNGKTIAIVVISFLGISACVILFIIKKRSYKNFIAILAVTASAIAFVCINNFSLSEDYYGKETIKKAPVGEVYISVDCKTLTDKEKNEFIPQNCVILDKTELEIETGDTVRDILIQACKEKNIHLEIENGYVSGINYLYEFDYGDLSGWIYSVNGEKASVGFDEYTLKKGDIIEWQYTCEMGNDIGDEKNDLF